MSERAAQLNADCRAGVLDGGRLKQALQAEGEDFLHAVDDGRHLFAEAVYFVTHQQMDQMRQVVAAVEQVVALPAWHDAVLADAGHCAHADPHAKGVFMGYDFHLTAEGAAISVVRMPNAHT